MWDISLAVPLAFEDEDAEAVEASVREAAEIGYSAVEPMIRAPAELDADALGRILDRYGMKLSGVRTGTMYAMDGLNLGDRDPDVRDRAARRLLDAVDLCGRFPGAKVLNGLMQGLPAADEEIPAKIARVTETLRRVVEGAERKAVGVCLEPVNRYELPYNNTLQSVADLIETIDSTSLQILIDTFHMNIEETDMLAAIRKHSRHIGAVHCADSNRLAPGMGHLDFRRILGSLRDAGYKGYLTIEMPGETTQHNHSAFQYLNALVKEQQ